MTAERLEAGPSLQARPATAPPRRLARILSLGDFEAAVSRHLPRPIFSFVSSAAQDGHSLRDNRAAFADYGFVTRVLRDVSQRSQGVELFGRRYSSPFGIAPLGLNALSAYRGDLVLARMAAEAAIRWC